VTGPHDVHLYLDDVDATSAYLAELRSIIDLQEDAKLRRGYKRALDDWITLARAMGDGYGAILRRTPDSPPNS
jgi:hypothetical protein